MTDVVDPATRSRMMASIRGKNTTPELVVRKGLHKLGLRYKLNAGHLPGRPDLVLPKYRTVVFVNGCFWHAHACEAFRMPAGNTEFWREKLLKNVMRDAKRTTELRALNWRVLVIWECATRLLHSQNGSDLCLLAHDWIVNYDSDYLELSRGKGNVISQHRTTARAI